MSKRTPAVKDEKEAQRQRIAAHRKDAMVALGIVYNDIARLARVSYSMVDKWANGRRASAGCDAAFSRLTRGLPAYPQDEPAAQRATRRKAG